MPIYMVGPIGQGLESRGFMGTSTVRGLVTKRRRPWSVCNTNHVFNKTYFSHLFGACPPVPLIVKFNPGGPRSRAGEVVARHRASNAAQKP